MSLVNDFESFITTQQPQAKQPVSPSMGDRAEITANDFETFRQTASISKPVEGTGGAAFGVFRKQDKKTLDERQARILEEKAKQDEGKTPFAQLYQDPNTFKKINDYAIARFGKAGLPLPNEAKEDYVKRWASHMRMLSTGNLISGTQELSYLNSASRADLLKAKDAYDLFENTASAFSPKGQQGFKPVLDVLGSVLSDPTTAISLGAGTLAKSAFLQKASQQGFKAALASRLGATAVTAVPAVEGGGGATSKVLEMKRTITTDAAQLAEIKDILPTLSSEDQAKIKPDVDALEAKVNAGVSGKEVALAGAIGAVGGTLETGALLLAGRAARGRPTALQDVLEGRKKPVETVSPKVEVKATDPTEKALEDAYDIFEGRKLLNAQGEPTSLAEMQIRNDVNKKATEIAGEIWSRVPDLAPAADQKVSDAVKNVFLNIDKIDNVVLEDALAKAGVTAEEFARMNRTTAGDAGRTLQAYSVLARIQNKLKSIDPAAAKEVDLMYGGRNALTSAFTGLKDLGMRVDRELKALMVSQLATTIRNGFSGAAVVTLGTASEAIESALYRVGKTAYELGSGKPVTGSFTGGVKGVYEDAVRTAFYLGQKDLSSDVTEALLAGSPALRGRILRTTGEAGVNELSKVAQIANTFNVAQDAFFRKAIFTSSVEKQLSRVGIDMYDVLAQGKNVPFDVLKNATDEALSATFSKMPTKGPMFHAVKFIEELGPIGSTVIPFPRFMANAMTWTYKHSPMGMLSGSADVTKGATMLAKGDEAGQRYLTQGLENVSKGAVGTAAIYAAYKYREANQDTAYYDIKSPDGSLVDARALFPFAPFLAMGDYLVKFKKGRTDEFSTKEFLEAMTGFKAPAGTYSWLGDKFSEALSNMQTGEGSADKKIATFFGEWAGEYFGRALVPAQQLSDIIGAIDRDETLPRDAYQIKPGEEGFLTSAKQQLMKRTPVVKQQLPEYQPATRDQAPFNDSGPLKMFTGITIKQSPTILEGEITRLKVPNNKIFTSTGDKIVDANARKIMAPLLVQTFDVVRDTDFYRQAGQDTQKIVMQNLLGWVQKNAKDIAVKTSEAEAFAEGKQARLFEVKYSALAPEVKRATAEFYKQNMKQDLAETKDYVSALAIAAALKKQPGFAVGGLSSRIAGDVLGTTLKKSASELLQEAKALAAKNVSTTEAVAPAVQQTKTMLAPAKKAAPQPVVEAAPTPVAPAVAEPAPSFLEATKDYSFDQMNQAESLLKTQMGSQYQLDKYKADFPADYQNSLLAKMKEIAPETKPAADLPTTTVAEELSPTPTKVKQGSVFDTVYETNNIDRLSEKLKNKFFNKVSKEADLNTIAGRKKGELREDFINRRKETIAAVKDIRVEAFNALKQLPQMGSISDDAIAVAQGDYRMMKKREVNLADPADINEFASFATNYQKRLDALREQYKDRPPERLYHGTTTERTPAKITRGFLDPQTIQNKQHHELNVGATSFTRDLRLNYYTPEFGGPNVKNISYTDIPYADYLFRRVDMPLSAYEKELGKDFNYMAQAITGSPDIARPLGLPRSLIFRETEDAFLESEKLKMKTDTKFKDANEDLKSFLKRTKPEETSIQRKYAVIESEKRNQSLYISNISEQLFDMYKNKTKTPSDVYSVYQEIKRLFKNEFRHTGTENTIKQGGLGSFKSNQTTDRRLEELVKDKDIVYSIDTVKKYLKEVGSDEKAEVLEELGKNLRVLKKVKDVDAPIKEQEQLLKERTEAVNAIRRLVGGEERVPKKLEGAEGPASQYPKNVKRLGLAKGGLGLKRQSSEEGLAPYGFRNSGEGVKGKGYFGELATKEGEVATELSSEFEYKGKTVEHPLLVPTLTKGEVDHLLAGKEPTAKIYDKAEGWAKQRIEQGKSPFAAPDELRMPAPDTETKYRRGGLASKRA